MPEKILDWKGNEVKDGMTIYFVQTKPGVVASSRMGLLIPQTGETIWEDEKDWKERKDKEIWELGRPYEVSERGGQLYITSRFENDPDIDSLTQPLYSPFGELPPIAIKGISDTKEENSWMSYEDAIALQKLKDDSPFNNLGTFKKKQP